MYCSCCQGRRKRTSKSEAVIGPTNGRDAIVVESTGVANDVVGPLVVNVGSEQFQNLQVLGVHSYFKSENMHGSFSLRGIHSDPLNYCLAQNEYT